MYASFCLPFPLKTILRYLRKCNEGNSLAKEIFFSFHLGRYAEKSSYKSKATRLVSTITSTWSCWPGAIIINRSLGLKGWTTSLGLRGLFFVLCWKYLIAEKCYSRPAFLNQSLDVLAQNSITQAFREMSRSFLSLSLCPSFSINIYLR